MRLPFSMLSKPKLCPNGHTGLPCGVPDRGLPYTADSEILRYMGGARQTADNAKAQATDALTGPRLKARKPLPSPNVGPRAVIALQRAAGNAAMSALMAGRLRFPGKEGVADIDGAVRELRRDEPAVDKVEKGLKAAKAAGVPVDLEGVRPPPSALAVTMTGFGPGSVAAKKPVPPPNKVPAVSPLGRAAVKKAAPAIKAKGGAGPAPAAPAGGGPAAAQPAAPLTADQLLQPPAPPSRLRPEDDPAFTQVTGKVKATARAKRAHPPAALKAKEAQDAALPPAGDVGSQAKAAKADTMDAQKPGTFDKKAFIAAVKAAIEAKSPKTLKEADNYKSSGKAGEVKGEVKGLVTEGKQGQAKDIEAATEAAPDQSKAVPKPVTPMGPEQEAPAPPIPAAGAVPKPAPPEQLNLAAGKQQANQEMAEAEVTEPQLAQSNEPEFQQALADKKAAAAHADTAPGEFRQQEAQVIQQGKADAAEETAEGVNGMQSAKGAALAKLVADKGKAKTKDEARRAEVTAKIEGIFNATEGDVKKILEGIDPKVEKEFNTGEASARATFENYVAAKMSAYKKDRYGGWLGGLRWAKDKLFGMPDKVNEFYVAGRELYLKEMDKVISRVADIVGNDLMAAKTRIAAGRNEIAAYVKSLPKDLKKVGAEASKEIGERFSQLESEVDSKQESLVDTLASKYVEARKGLDDRIEELQAENKGLVDKAIGAIKAVINTIRELVAMLKNVLARAAGVVGEIIKNPVGFLGNLIAGVKGGILKFKENILDHLRKGLMSWLFGSLAEAGIELPDTFDLKGIIKLLASIFGLTWTNIRNRIVKQIGEKAMAAVEKGVEIFQIISTQGIGGLWQMLLEKLGNIREMILEQVKDFVITKIITAGITWLIGLLNPAAAFIKACKLIYDVVMFFVNNGERIMKFVNTVLDSVSDIVRGSVSSVVNKINDVLGQMVPIIIGFLASLIGLGGIGQKIREIVEKLQKPVNKALDFVIKTGLKLAGPIIRGLKGLGTRAKAKFSAGVAKIKAKVRGGDDTSAGRQRRLVLGVDEGVSAANRFAGKTVGDKVLRPVLAAIRMRRGLSVLEPVRQGDMWAVHGEVQRITKPTAAKAGAGGIDWDKAPATKLIARGLNRDEITHIFAQTTTDKIKSAIMEALLARLKGKESAAATKASKGKGKGKKPDEPQPEFIAGRRIKSSAGAEFTDGIDAILGASDSGKLVVRVLKIYEAKSSERQKYKLATEHERYSRMPKTPEGRYRETEMDRLRREVIDQLIAEHYPEALAETLTPEQARDAHQAAKAKVLKRFGSSLETRMKATYRERTTGQAVRSRERLSPDVDLMTGKSIPVSLVIDGMPRRVVGYSPTKTVTVGVLPSDVKPGEAMPEQLKAQGVRAEFMQVGITASALATLASEVRKAQNKK
jgi:hypothetical protein